MKAIIIIKKYELELLLIIYQLMFLLVNNFPFKVKDSVVLCYLNDFSTGFGPRKLIASLASFLFGDFVSYNEICFMCLIVSVVLIVVFSLFVGYVYRSIETNKRQTFLYLILLYMSCSFAVTFLYQWATFGRMEAWHILILVIYMITSRKIKSNYRPLLMLVACVISMIIHHMFLSTFLSAYLFLTIYELKKKDFDKVLLIKYFVVFSCVAVSFLFLHFIKWNEMPYNEALAYLNNKTNAEVSDYFVRWIYYEPISNHLSQFVKPYLVFNICCILLSVLLFLPLYYVLFKGVRRAVLLAQNSSNGKLLILYVLACLPMLISYVSASDFGRWTASHFNCFFLFFIYLLSEKNFIATEMLSSFEKHIKVHKVFYIMLPLYLLLFSKNMCKFPIEFHKLVNIVLGFLGMPLF